MTKKWKMALIAAVAAGLSMTACVDQQASLVMMGSMIGDYDSEAGTCEYPLDMTATSTISTSGFVDLASLNSMGQPQVQGGPPAGSPGVYYFVALYENRLVDSRTVGSESGGGSGGGFQNLDSNQNDVVITSATVAFPAASNTFNIDGTTVSFARENGADANYERLFSMLVTSGQGSAITHIPLINGPREAADFEAFMSGVPEGEPLTFMAEIQLHGESLSGNSVESNRFEYPVQVCRNCGRPSQALCVGSIDG